MLHQMGKLYVVATPIGNLDDISQRACNILNHVDWIAAEDTRHSKGLLQHLGISTPLVSYHEHNERERTSQLIEKLCQGENGALISDAGTPLISDPGYFIVTCAHERGIQVIPVPGACAAIAALSVAGLPTDKFLFEGFLPAKPQARDKRLAILANFPHTMVFYEAPHRIASLLEACLEHFTSQRRISLAREITKKFESIYCGELGKIVADIHNGTIPLKGEFIVVMAGAQVEVSDESEQKMQHVLSILLPEMPLKQAVQIAMKLTGGHKNALYDMAMKMKNEMRGENE